MDLRQENSEISIRTAGQGLVEITSDVLDWVDLIGLDAKGRFTIVEVKSSPADFRADDKWPGYRPYCDGFYFAVGAGFPTDLIPEDCGLIVADAYGAVVRRPAPTQPMHATRRRAQVLRFGLAGAGRLERLLDPQP